MGIESVRGYIQIASGLGDLTRARAMEAAQGLLSLAGVGAGAGKVGQVGALAEELLAAATANRENLISMIRTEVDAAVLRLGLVPADRLEQSRHEVARLKAEVASLRATTADAKPTATKRAASKRAATKSAATRSAATRSAATERSASQTTAEQTPAAPAVAAKPVRRSAVTTRRTGGPADE